MSHLIPFQFEGQDIQVMTDAHGEPWFVAKQVASVLGYSDAEAMTRRLDDDEKQNLQIVGFGPRGVTLISESGLYAAIIGSSKPEAKPFKRWITHDVLPSIRKTGAYFSPSMSRPEPAPKLVGELAIMECFTKLLRPAPSSQVAMLQHIGKRHSLDTSFLPAYVGDAAVDGPAGSSMPTASLTALLKEHGITTNVPAYNALLRDAGMLEERTRASKSGPGGKKHFWSITEQGLAYGKNITSPASQRETQPHWYVDRFAELHRIVTGRLIGKRGEE
ncbi:hypothetical protein CAL29_28225 [Bordetella genomosp. 10]|uniref:Bro-N domain-containing protein n=1 Tax=Bordetella genomosp. 10 TaxID=1416804 RepID=A0A261S330_9BORD|nr:BRO family protein [Bordetella genomosp. 10]OZI31759.1 hypothetical protein CAL29_28225 [Bordetella genomosp. 10]